MKVKIKIGGPLRERLKGFKDGEMDLELDQGARVSEVFPLLSLKVEDVRVIMLNRRPLARDMTLKDGDRLALFPPELAFNCYVAINFFNNLIRETRPPDHDQDP